MGTNLPERQKWLESALQGLAFWIGHRRSLFRHYPLTEGALVAEACNLIQANLSSDLVLLPERMYKNLVARDRLVAEVGPKARADLVICSQGALAVGTNSNVAAFTRFVIEVKRANAAKQLIDGDLLRLHNYLMVASPGTRAIMLIVSEGSAPRRFVKEGASIRGNHEIPGADGYFRVRRSVKAAAAFSGKETAHYVCLLEVFLVGDRGKKI